jgi:hypothetical protein
MKNTLAKEYQSCSAKQHLGEHAIDVQEEGRATAIIADSMM